MKIMVGSPIHRPLDFKVFEAFVRLANYRGPHEYHFVFIQHSLVYDGRQYIADQFLKSDCEYLMFIDSDMTFDPRAIEILVSTNLDFVTAKAFKRVYPYQPCFYTKVQYNGDTPHLESPVQYGVGLLPIEGAGLACALIKRSVFEKIEAPYFFPLKNLGEDLTFCLKLKDAGIEMYCDTRVQFGHVGSSEILEDDFKRVYEDRKAKGLPIFI
jgi:hypothetical protein